MISKETIQTALETIKDPELGLNIIDLGLIYQINIKGQDVEVVMTLTFPGCPWGEELLAEVRKRLTKIKGVGEVKIDLTFDPPWDISRISAEARMSLGIV